MTESNPENVSRREKVEGLVSAARYKPKLTVSLIVLGLAVAMLEGIGLTFILPVIELIQGDNPVAEADVLSLAFVRAYRAFRIPFTLASAITGVACVMTLRSTGSFVYGCLRKILRFTYQRHLQKQAVDSALNAKMDYFDEDIVFR